MCWRERMCWREHPPTHTCSCPCLLRADRSAAAPRDTCSCLLRADRSAAAPRGHPAHACFARIAVRLRRGGSLLTLASRESQCGCTAGTRCSRLLRGRRPSAAFGGNACGNERAKRARFRFLSLSYSNERRTATTKRPAKRKSAERRGNERAKRARFRFLSLSYSNERRTANPRSGPRSGNPRRGAETSDRNELVPAFSLSYSNERRTDNPRSGHP